MLAQKSLMTNDRVRQRDGSQGRTSVWVPRRKGPDLSRRREAQELTEGKGPVHAGRGSGVSTQQCENNTWEGTGLRHPGYLGCLGNTGFWGEGRVLSRTAGDVFSLFLCSK